ncbi:MAG: hypothetical protein KAS15_07390 [Nanoarchaeota archaeon]|nr:hypothetical protein [Nanoarchaeota archaeon]
MSLRILPGNLDSLIKKFDYLIVFIALIFLLFIFKGINHIITFSPAYIIINCIIYIIMLLLFIYLVLFILGKKIRDKTLFSSRKADIIFTAIVALFSFILIFICLKDNLVGRFQIIRWMLGDIFIKEIFYDTLIANPRTYSMVLYSVLQEFFHIKVTPLTLLYVNKIISFFMILTVFFISRKVFKKNWISIIVVLSFVSSIFIQMNLTSIEYGIVAIFFTCLSILLLIKFSEKKHMRFFILSNVCAILAAYNRHELSLLFGIPYIAYYCIFISKHKATRKYMTATTVILAFILMSVVKYFTYYKDPYMQGTEISGTGFFSYISNLMNVINHNLFIQNDFSLQSGYVSLFSYLGPIISLILIAWIAYKLIKQQHVKSKYSILYLFAFYNLFYLFFQLSVHMGGLRDAIKYSVNYFICEIILVYFAVCWVVGYFMSKKPEYLINATKSVCVLFFFIVIVSSSITLSLKPVSSIEPEVPELILLNGYKIDESCYIIKVHPAQPKIDYYYGLQRNVLFFGRPPFFYENIRQYPKTGKCFYYYDEKTTLISDQPQIELGSYEHYYNIDSKKIDGLFDSCNKNSELKLPVLIKDNNHTERNITKELIKYSC